MLLFSSVAVAGSVIPAGPFSVNAAPVGWNRLESRSNIATPVAAKIPDIKAMTIIWRAESLYMALLQAYEITFARRVLLGCPCRIGGCAFSRQTQSEPA